MGKKVIHTADSRGTTYTGWLHSRHTFSFGRYHDASRMGFGALRVLNDDIVKGGMGFDEHPHRDMEIVSIPLEGDLEHRDSMGNAAVIRQGDIQVMSAGTGIRHSEYNRNHDEAVKFLQIWIFPKRLHVEPRYQQVTLDPDARKNRLKQVLSPENDGDGVRIHQDAWFHLGAFDADVSVSYELRKQVNGLYGFVLKGSFDIEGETLSDRDGIGITGVPSVAFRSLSEGSEILLMEVPMEDFME